MEKDIIYGRNAVAEALAGKRKIKQVFISTQVSKGSFDSIIGTLTARDIPLEFRNPISLKRFAGSDSHQGIVAVVEPQQYASVRGILNVSKAKKEAPFIIILDGIEDPQNLGSVIRSAECAGAHGVIIPEHHAVGLTGSVAKVASGAAEHVKLARVPDIAEVIEELKENNIKIVGSDADAKPIYYNIPMREGVALVIGSESEGVRHSVKKKCDVLVSIPMRGKINSLNAAVAAAVLMFEVVRQRTK